MKYKVGDIIEVYEGSVPHVIIAIKDPSYAKYMLLSIHDQTCVNVVTEQTMLLGAKMLMSSPKVYAGPLTQEEIDEIIDSYNNGNYDPNDYNNTFTLTWDEDDIPGIISNEPPAFKGCSHKWKKYVGIVQTYEYCEYCDKKKNEV